MEVTEETVVSEGCGTITEASVRLDSVTVCTLSVTVCLLSELVDEWTGVLEGANSIGKASYQVKETEDLRGKTGETDDEERRDDD